MSEELPPWGKIQKRTFTRWCNVHLAERKLKVDDLESDFADGFKLLNLLEVISGKKIQYNKNVKFYSQKLENVGKALKFIRDQGIKLVAIGPEDIVEKRIKLILGLIWTIILRYQINKVEYIAPDNQSSAPGNVVQNQDLLQWVNATVPEFHVKNFKGDWKDGKVLYALVNAVKPGAVDPALSVTLAPIDRAGKAIAAAKVSMNIPELIDANDMVSDHSDDLSTMTYVSFFRAYAAKANTPDAANSQVSGAGIKKAKVGAENPIVITAKNSFGDPVRVGGANFTAKVFPKDNPSAAIPVTIKDKQNGQYEVTYSPDSPGPHVVEVTLDGAPVSKSPFTVEVKDVPIVDPKNSAITKDVYVGPDGLTHFEVTTKDKSGNPVSDLSVPVVASVVDTADGTDAHVTVTPIADGVYDITIAPPKSGEYEVKVGLKDTSNPKNLVGGKPFRVTLNPPAEKPKPISADDIAVDLANIGKPNEDGIVRFILRPKKKDADIKNAKFNVAVRGPGGKDIPTEITSNPDGTFEVTLAPTDTGDHNIKISFSDPSGETSELSPIDAHIEVKPAEEEIPAVLLNAAARTKVDLNSLSNGLDPLGKLHFSVVPDDLPEGVKVVPKLKLVSQGADLPIEVGVPTEIGVDVAFAPPSSGEYELQVHLEKDGKEVPVPNTPLKFKVELPEHKPAEAAVQKAAEDVSVDFSGLSAEPTEDGGVSFNVDCGKKLPDGAKFLSKILFVPDGSIVPNNVISDGDEGKYRVIFYPKHTEGPAEYLVALSLSDKDGNEAKVRGGPYRVNVIIVKSAEYPNVNPRVVKVAKEASLDMKPLNSGPNKEGKMHFDIINLPETLPKGSHIESKITNTADNSDIPVELKHEDGKYGVYFKPAGSGVYMIEAILVDEDDNGANFSGAPVRLTLNLGTAPPRSANAPDALVEKAAEASKIDLASIGKGPNKDGDLEFAIETPDLPEGAHLESTVIFVPDNLDLPSKIIPSPTEKGKNTVAFKPVRTGEYMIAANIVDKDGKPARVKGTPVRLMLTLPEQAVQPIRATPNQKLRDVAENSKVDLAPIGEGLNADGQVHFFIDAKDIPADAVLAPKVAFNNQELPVNVRPVEGTDGKYSVEFPPSGSGEYLISASILDKEGLPAKVKGTPIRLNLKLPESQGVKGSRPSTPVVHPPTSPRIFTDTPPSTPTHPTATSPGSHPIVTPAPAHLSPSLPTPKATTPRQPSPLVQSRTAASLESDPAGKPHSDLSLDAPHPASEASGVEEDPATDEEHTVMWAHSFQIEAKTKKGAPRIKGGDIFSVSINGPQGAVENIKIEDLGTGKYQVSYLLPGHGKYIIKAQINGRDIVGSPFTQKI